MSIRFKQITEENFDAVVNMKVSPSQERFVASNCRSLAQAWLYYENHDVFPFAVYHDETPVGFILLDEDAEERSINIWRIMIDLPHQGKGYATNALRLLVRLCRESGKYDRITIDYVKTNDAARHVYEKVGFIDTGETCNGNETVMSMTL